MLPSLRSPRRADSPLQHRQFPWLQALALFALTVATYIPSMTNGFIWDDPQYVVENPTLKSAEGLWRIWTDPLATPQYYPMVHSTFWIEAQLWGTEQAAGFHVDNILLHALAAVLLWRALAALQLPWPWLAAAIFAVHPVMVESVGWVTERKNVLSIVFYLMAFHAYLRSGLLDEPDSLNLYPGHLWKNRWYVAALALFLLALLSKTVTCSLPAAILLIVWWKRGRITASDIAPLVPMFVVGVLLSGLTGHLEHTHVGANGPDFNWSPLDRCLIAGHAICFYTMKILWPHPLMFMYPRWVLQGIGPFVYPAVVVVMLLILWSTRRWIGRGPLTAALFFIGTLVPALGFVNVYPMRYSFVADHFQYLASIGCIVLITAGLTRLTAILPRQLILVLVLTPLIWLTISQQQIYRDQETLWKNTIAQNPTCWMAHVNLAGVYGRAAKGGKPSDAALHESELALALAPNEADTQYDMGVAMAQRARWQDAAARFRAATDCDPQCVQAWSYLALVLWQHPTTPEMQSQAIQAAQKAVNINPDQSAAQFVLGSFAELRGDLPAAIADFIHAVAVDPADYPAHTSLGNCLLETGRASEAAGEYQKVITHDPKDVAALTNMGNACLMAGRTDDARLWYQRALAIDPGWKPASERLRSLRH